MARSRVSVVRAIKDCSEEVQWFFSPICKLIEDGYDFSVALAYAFSQLEQGQRNALYCAMRKVHSVNSEIAWLAVRSAILRRKDYRRKFKDVVGANIKKEMLEAIEKAEATRDKTMHGHGPSEAEKRSAIVSVLTYADQINDICSDKHGFRPFGRLQGFAGRGQTLPKSTSRLVAKGLGFLGGNLEQEPSN